MVSLYIQIQLNKSLIDIIIISYIMVDGWIIRWTHTLSIEIKQKKRDFRDI